MKNCEILVQSLDEWITPIATKAASNLANNNIASAFVAELIDPGYAIDVLKNLLGLPEVLDFASMLPDKRIPDLTANMIEGMIQKRVASGSLRIPILGVRLTPDAFRNLKQICISNFEEYSETLAAPEPTETTDQQTTTEEEK
ncbi:MAG: hypothetical protein R3Y68_09445 [Rikenellaceae bacterium]